MRWLSNTYNPNLPDAKHHVDTMPHQTPEEAWHWHKVWLSGKIIGEPQATDTYTVEQLKAMDLVGVYVEDDIMLSGSDAKDFIRDLLGE